MSDATDSHSDSRDEALPMFDFYVEQLETYLDGELDDAEAADVRKRLSEEPAYAAALDRLHHQRQMRLELFGQTNESEQDDLAAARLRACASRMCIEDQRAYSRRAPGRSISRWWISSAIAACMVIAFGLGMYGRFDRGTTPGEITSNPMPKLEGNTMFITDDHGDIVVTQKLDNETVRGDVTPSEVLIPDQRP